MIRNYLIKNFDGSEVSFQEFCKSIERYIGKEYEVCVGSDSQRHFDHTVMVTAIVVFNRLKGNDCFYIKEKVPNERYKNLRVRIFDETFRSIHVATEIKSIFNCDVSIHMDIGDDPRKNATHAFVSELSGLVEGQGFSYKIKPESFASSGFADCLTK